MIEEKTKQRIGKLRESGLTVKETAKTLEVSESTVKKYSSDDSDKDNELDEKISDEMTKIMLLEGYDFEDEIKPLIYALKDEVNIMDITLWNHINDIKNNTNTFLRLTDNPIRLYYIFMLFASNLNLITDHIEPKTLIEVIDNFIDREVSMEDAENYIDTWNIMRKEEYEELKEKILNAKEEYNEHRKRIENAKKEAMSEVESKSKTILKNSKEAYAEYKEKIDSAKKDLDSINITRTVLIEELEKIEKIETENQELKSENQNLKILLKQTNEEKTMMELIYEKVSGLFPQECISILNEIKNEQL